MLITKIASGVNAKLAGEMLTYREMIPHLDDVIDDINQKLNSNFPAFSELESTVTDYNFFPDRYIRKAVITGAAHYFYMKDEEGNVQDTGYFREYDDALFMMLRDYLTQVPAQYQADDKQGSLQFTLTGAVGQGIYDHYEREDE
jgi:hypothetical protein